MEPYIQAHAVTYAIFSVVAFAVAALLIAIQRGKQFVLFGRRSHNEDPKTTAWLIAWGLSIGFMSGLVSILMFVGYHPR